MYGNYEDGKQIPITGNKGIVCNECKFSMYGKEIANTWTQIASTISVGDTTLTV